MKDFTKIENISRSGSTDRATVISQIDDWMEEFKVETEHSLNDNVAGVFCYEELIALLLDCQRHLKEAEKQEDAC